MIESSGKQNPSLLEQIVDRWMQLHEDPTNSQGATTIAKVFTKTFGESIFSVLTPVTQRLEQAFHEMSNDSSTNILRSLKLISTLVSFLHPACYNFVIFCHLIRSH